MPSRGSASPTGGLEGLAALVTGGGSGIGLAAARRFAADGARVTICGRTAERLAGAAAELEEVAALPGEVRWQVADVTVEEEIAAAVAKAAEPDGRLDILFACAGGASHLGPLADADAAAVRATVDLNLIGSFLSLQHAIGPMRRAGGGSIVLMSSGAGHFPHRYLTAYGMAKAGVEMLCSYAAEELGPDGIRVNVVQPGIVETDLTSVFTGGGPLLEDYLAEMPIRRLGTVEDVAAAVRYLAGPEASWVTGTRLAVDGGHHLRRGANYGLLFEP
ncbi:MAG TPA: SDR family oxidoreductase [Acidimicrobiales bacterium]|nr:SDR family oxidoreductase [Acidimicrobiales bacterium]